MKIICTMDEYYHLNEVICCGCCWIGQGEGRKKNKENKGKLVDLEKFRKAVDLMSSKSTIEWEISYD